MVEGSRLTQQVLGERAGIAQGKAAAVAVSRIEKGFVRVTPARLAALAAELGSTADALEQDAHDLLAADARTAAMIAASGDGDFGAKIENLLVGPLARENRARRLRIEREVQIRQQDADRHLGHLADVQAEFIASVLDPFIEFTRQQDWTALGRPAVPEAEGDASDPVKGHSDRDHQQYERNLRDLQAKILRDVRRDAVRGPSSADVIGRAAAAGGVGAAVGGAASGLLASWVTASAVASTGTAISSLAGAAATNATLAWLGGGTLAAGGFGVAGGTLVLASVVTLPALIIAGGVFVYQRRQMQAKAHAESDRLNLAEAELERSRVVLRQTWSWIDTEYVLLSKLASAGRWKVHALRSTRLSAGSPDESPNGGSADGDLNSRIAQVAQVVALASTLIGLPILRDLEPEAEQDPHEVTTERHEWIAFVLAESQQRIEQIELPG